MKPADSPFLAEAFGDAMAAETLRNARLINRVRLAVLSAFLLLHVLLGTLFHQKEWQAALVGLALYWVAALIIFLAGRKRDRFARISGYVVGLLDVPMAFLIQAGSLASASDARAAAMFNVGVLLFLIMLAALALRAGQIWLTAGVSVLCQISLQRLADDSLGGIIASVLLLGAGAGVCTFALKRRLELVRQVIFEQSRRERLGRYLSPAVARHVERQEGVWSPARSVRSPSCSATCATSPP